MELGKILFIWVKDLFLDKLVNIAKKITFFFTFFPSPCYKCLCVFHWALSTIHHVCVLETERCLTVLHKLVYFVTTSLYKLSNLSTSPTVSSPASASM